MYKKENFKSCMFNPLTNDRMLDAYPRLKELVDCDIADIDQILRYIIMVYDPKSPLVINERDLPNRQGEAANLAGITDEDLQAQLFTHTHEHAPELITRFLVRFVKSKEFSAICAFEFCFAESIRKLLEPISGKGNKEQLDAVQKKSMIKQELLVDIKRLEELYDKFFGGDSSLAQKARGRLTPELMSNLKSTNVSSD